MRNGRGASGSVLLRRMTSMQTRTKADTDELAVTQTFLSRLQGEAVFGGREAGALLEQAGEMALVAEACGRRNRAQRHLAGELAPCELDSPLARVSGAGRARGRGETCARGALARSRLVLDFGEQQSVDTAPPQDFAVREVLRRLGGVHARDLRHRAREREPGQTGAARERPYSFSSRSGLAGTLMFT